jgi:putative tRNA adenosine deaminase-associated protein
VAHSAIAVTLSDDGWVGDEVDLSEVEDLDTLTELLRDRRRDGPVLLFVEEDDEYLGIVRVDGDGDPRVFLSDRRALGTSELASRLFEDALPVGVPVPADDDEDARPAAADPVGDVELLADLGTPGDVVVELCAEEGMLPGDVTSALGERGGFADVLDQVRAV